jgi:hypothetical protein
MLTYPLNFPSIPGVREFVLRARSTVGASTSPFTAQQQVYVHQGEWFEADVTLPPMKPDPAEDVVAFLLSLNGMEGTFLMPDLGYRAPRGSALGAPLVNGAGQTGKTLVTDNWNVSITNLLKPGDEFQLGTASVSRLYKVTAPVNSNGSGQATIEIWPRLRESPADNAVIWTESPKSVWRLMSNDSEWSVGVARIYGLRFSCREAL